MFRPVRAPCICLILNGIIMDTEAKGRARNVFSTFRWNWLSQPRKSPERSKLSMHVLSADFSRAIDRGRTSTCAHSGRLVLDGIPDWPGQRTSASSRLGGRISDGLL